MTIDRALVETPDDADALTTRGILHYRLADFALALATLEISAAYHADETRLGTPADLAFLAMVHHQLGNHDDARQMLAHLQEAMKDPRHALSKDNQLHLAEAEALLGDMASSANDDTG